MRRPGAAVAQAPAQLRPAVVTEYTPAAKTATVDLDGQLVVLPVLAGTYAVGGTVLVARNGNAGGYVLGTIGTAPAPELPPELTGPPPPAPAPPRPPTTSTPREPTAYSRTITPVQVESYRPTYGWRDAGDAYQGDYGSNGLNTGCVFYGTQLSSLGADLDQPYSARLTYYRLRGGDFSAQAPTFWQLQERRRPAGAPTRIGSSSTGTAVAVDRSATWDLPTSWVRELLEGDAGGLAVYVPGATPYMRLAGTRARAAAFALTVRYYAT